MRRRSRIGVQTPPPLPAAESSAVYVAAPRSAQKAAWLFIASASLVAVAAVGFFIALRLPENVLRLHATTTLPMIGAFSCLGAAFTLWRSPREVRLTPAGVSVSYANRTDEFPWDQIALAAKADTGMSGGKALKLYDGAGRVLAKLSDNLIGFDDLARALDARLAARPHVRASTVTASHSRKRAALLALGGMAALALAGANGWLAYDDARAARLLREAAVAGEAIIVRKFIAPDRRTHRIEFRVADVADAPLENVEFDRILWAVVAEGQRLPARYVPAEPGISRLEMGQIDAEPMSPTMQVVGSVFVGLLGLALVVASVLEWRKGRPTARATQR